MIYVLVASEKMSNHSRKVQVEASRRLLEVRALKIDAPEMLQNVQNQSKIKGKSMKVTEHQQNAKGTTKILSKSHCTHCSSTYKPPNVPEMSMDQLYMMIKNFSYQIFDPPLFLRIPARYLHTMVTSSCKSSIPFITKSVN